MDWSILQEHYFDNSVRDYIACGLILLLGFVFSRLIARFASSLSYRIFKRLSRAQFHTEFVTVFTLPFRQLVILYCHVHCI